MLPMQDCNYHKSSKHKQWFHYKPRNKRTVNLLLYMAEWMRVGHIDLIDPSLFSRDHH